MDKALLAGHRTTAMLANLGMLRACCGDVNAPFRDDYRILKTKMADCAAS